MKNLTTPKEVFTYVRDEVLSEKTKYICHCLDKVNLGNSDYLIKECFDIMEQNKPIEGDDFTKDSRWQGTTSWWDFDVDDEKEVLSILQEKRRFLTYLISKI